MTEAYCEVWEGGRRVGSALYDCDRIAPMQPYRDPRMQHRVTAAAALREQARDSCTPSRYNSRTSRRYESDYGNGWDNFEGWDGELPDDEPMPQPQHVTLKPAPAVAPLPVVAPTPAPVAVPDWPVRPAVVEPEPVPVVVNYTAARFGALEIRRE
jgi:hypothetical protein